jgi:hypothetical protein
VHFIGSKGKSERGKIDVVVWSHDLTHAVPIELKMVSTADALIRDARKIRRLLSFDLSSDFGVLGGYAEGRSKRNVANKIRVCAAGAGIVLNRPASIAEFDGRYWAPFCALVERQ